MSNTKHKSLREQKVLHLPKYFDFSAATPVHPEVLEVMMPFFSERFYNPSALYKDARDTQESLDEARGTVARLIGAKPTEIIFTAGGSEAISLALRGIMNHQENEDAAVLISAIEHDAVRRTAQEYRCETVGVDNHGLVIIEELTSILKSDDSIVLASLIYVSNEIGTIQHISSVSAAIRDINKKRRKNGKREVLLHIDASQAPLYLDCNVARLGVDLMTLNGGKIYGPKQSGTLYVRTGVELSPVIRGGGQEFGVRSGTENVAFAVGFAKALDLASRGREERAEHTTAIRNYLMEQLEAIGGELYGHRTKRIAHNVLVGFEKVDNEVLLIKLDTLGFCVAIGSACHASSGEPSHVLKALGLKDEIAQSTVRLSINEYTTKEDCNNLVDAIKKSL